MLHVHVPLVSPRRFTSLAVLTALCMWGTSLAVANNIQVSNTRLVDQNTADDHTFVQFDLSWENSWRVDAGPSNWDAAWVFVKYRVPVARGGDGLWKHARLGNEGHVPGEGMSAAVGLVTPGTAWNATTNPAVGVFIYRSQVGRGDINLTGVRLRWNYADNGLSDPDLVEIRVFAIEMVYVPQGSFYVGSGGVENGSFTNGSWTSGATIPFQITSENALSIAQSAGSLWGTSNSGNNTIGGAGTLAASYPKGFQAFYSMKYEITQGQYRDFLNSLSRDQQDLRVHIGNTVGRYAGYARWVGYWDTGVAKGSLTEPLNRNGLRLIADPGGSSPRTYACDLVPSTTLPTGVNQADDGEWIAYNAITWPDAAAYFDWSGLRPMTELEFEKAARGSQAPVADEHAWGSTIKTSATGISQAGSSSETASNAGANTVWNNIAQVAGPLRVGSFATATSTRAQSGSGYWGILDLSGNLNEIVITVGTADGRAYTGGHGNGTLATTGNADVSGWPGLVSAEVSAKVGTGARGGSFSERGETEVSNRANASYAGPGDGRGDSGFRGVRTAP